tara:strand:- start:105 stop:1259 length:1155 start_codon:yes stop_codon:yes gene_type:complete
MKKSLIIFISYIIIFFNSNLFSNEKEPKLKIGLLAPLSGEYKELGESLLYTLQLALDEIDDKDVFIIPRDSGFNDKDKLDDAIQSLKAQETKVIIGPISNNDFNYIKKYSDLIFVSPSNISPEFTNNIISVGVSLESQIFALKEFLKKQKKKNTVIMFPNNQYAKLIEDKLEKLNLGNIKKFKYSPNPEILTGEIEILTNYAQRKKNLELRKKLFQDKEDDVSMREMEKLEQLYTLGGVNFDSVIIIDFGDSLKSVLTSLVYTDVDQSKVLFTTVNQWFDESIFYENTIKTLYYPSIDYKEFKKYNKVYFKQFESYPNEISILAYDALGLIYYAWRENGKIETINDLTFKNKIKGKIGTFVLKDRKVFQELEIYKVEENKFTKS